MKVLTDEHVSPVIANTLQSEGIDAVTIYDTPVSGKDNPAVLEFANEHEAMILTNDLDFITQQFVEDADHWGILPTQMNARSSARIVTTTSIRRDIVIITF